MRVRRKKVVSEEERLNTEKRPNFVCLTFHRRSFFCYWLLQLRPIIKHERNITQANCIAKGKVKHKFPLVIIMKKKKKQQHLQTLKWIKTISGIVIANGTCLRKIRIWFNAKYTIHPKAIAYARKLNHTPSKINHIAQNVHWKKQTIHGERKKRGSIQE